MFIKKLKSILVLSMLMGTTVLLSCSDDDTPAVETQKDIVELAAANSNLSSLVAAVDKAGLASVLKGNGPFTVFAPTNAAFQALLDSNSSWNTLNDIPQDVLVNVLKFHVLSSEVKSGQLTNGYTPTLATGPNSEYLSLQVATTGGVKFNGSAAPVSVDIDAKNGVVHVIDKVMLPPNVVELALNNPDFSSLVAALTDSRHTTDFVAVLKGNGPFTVFAPTNAAFKNLLDSNASWNSIADIPIATLEAVLKYHVVNAANVQAKQLTDKQEITMLNNAKVTVDLTNGAKLKSASNQEVNITATDVQGANGVIHVIDKVLIPGT
ncbi:Uncaracterized surface protein containing fasciclin (FAS1) repeats [Tenacibaculum litopenaei]|uniref:fasciclin domain-containing protein n=1 Tax=Tenacibaculum litopenaei TaxID=396016 RepID=UPI0038933382